MRKLLILFILLLLPLAAFCGKKHKIVKLPVSRWKEVKRMKLDSTIVPFTDTLFISFLKKDSFIYHNKNGFIYRGGYTIDEDSLLDFGTARFRIVMKRPTTLVLTDDKGMYVMGPDSSDTGKIIVLKKNEKYDTVTSIDQMIGHWTVYKREAKEQAGGVIDNAVTINALYITGPSTDGKQGVVFSGSDPGSKPSWYIKGLNTDQTLDCDGKNRRILKVLKCQNGEMILEENEIKYYLKQFK
jgi:hypothetical protein